MVKHSLQILPPINLIPTLGKSELCIELELHGRAQAQSVTSSRKHPVSCTLCWLFQRRDLPGLPQAELLKVGSREDQRHLGRDAQPANLLWIETFFPSSSLLLSLPFFSSFHYLPTILLFFFFFCVFFFFLFLLFSPSLAEECQNILSSQQMSTVRVWGGRSLLGLPGPRTMLGT